jgi:Tol biopolymer transport system component/DNA-binding winged helix-turn-helix (wHTH) protein
VKVQPNGKLCFADFEIDTSHRLLRRDGEPVALNAKAFDVLEFLAQNAGRVVTKNEILDAVWENQFVEEANLKVQISALRKVLGEQKNEHRFLVTLPGKGYKFVGEIRNGSHEIVLERHEISHVVVEQETEVTDTPDVAAAGAQRSKWFARSAAVAGILLIAFGGYSAWNRSSANAREIVSAEPDAKIKRLTNRGRVNRAVISPNGEFFAYTEVEKGTLRTELRIGQTDGGGERTLRPIEGVFHHPISFSADGSWLYYTNTDPATEHRQTRGELYKAPIVGGVPQKLGDRVSMYAAISPDEKLIAFPQWNDDRTSVLMVAALDGSNEREIVRRPGDRSIDSDSLSWSPDGTTVAFSATTGSSKTDASRSTCEIFLANVNNATVEQMPSLEWNRVMLTRWLSDSSGLIIVGRDQSQQNTSSVWSVDVRSGKAARISRDANRYAGYLTLSGDGSKMVAIQFEPQSNLWVGSPDDPSAASQITFSTSGRQDGWYGMDWAADDRLVYTAWIDESLTIWSAAADGSDAKQLTSIGFRDRKPVVTPDGRFVVFESNRSGSQEIWRINIDGADLQQLTRTRENSDPSVTTDGGWIVYRHDEDPKSSIWRIPIGGGEPVLVIDQDATVPRVSPDGRHVAFGATREGKMKLVLVRLDGMSDESVAFDVPETYNFRYSLHWTPDSRFVTYPDEANGVWQQSIDGGPPTRMPGLPAERIFSYAWSRDGKSFAYGRQREVRDAVLISNFR